MPRITDPDYRLPRLTTLRYHDTFTGGANLPGLVTARDQRTRESVECVVKFRGAERMSPEAYSRELLAAFIAKEWGIRVVEPVLVDVIPEFVGSQRGKPHYQVLLQSVGLNYGSVYVSGYETIPVHQPLTDSELPQAQQIVASDLFIQNPDRNVIKPNLMSNGRELVIYDHELAFGFVQDIFKNPRPYELRDIDQHWINSLFLVPKIRQTSFPEADIEQVLSRLGTNFWDRAFELIPPDWQTEQLPVIGEYLTQTVRSIPQFLQSVKSRIQ